MYSTEPEKARPDGVEGEVLSSFKLAGSRGNLRTVLTQDHVTLELKSGSYLRLGYNKWIDAMYLYIYIYMIELLEYIYFILNLIFGW